MKSLVLIGFMGTGKSTLGRALSGRLGLPLVDLDTIIVQEQQMEIEEIFARQGETAFRQMEHEALCRYAVQPNLILSPGGGAVLRAENRAVLREHCLVISLFAQPEIILQRVEQDATVRPVLEQREAGQSKLARIEQVLEQRRACYQEADLLLDTSHASVEQLTAQVLAWLEEQTGERL